MSFSAAVGSILNAATGIWSMSFQTVHYFLFLPVVVGAYFVLPQKLRRPWLLLASYYFYFFSAPKYLPVLLAGTVFTYAMGRLLGRARGTVAKRWLLATGILLCVLALSFFKYNGFFAQFLAPALKPLGLDYMAAYQSGAFTTAAAVGISYYTFTAIGYLIDVYRGDVPAERNLLNIALFLGFFPSVVSGPISRAGDLLPQLKDNSSRFDAQNAADALRLMALGFFKKLAVADVLAVYVSRVYSAPNAYTGLSLTLAAVGFALQLYFDFSGYTDIALGSAQMLGIRLPQNFNTPYFATNFSGFWARWHMSLSTWLQDYIFTPLVWSRWPEKTPVIKHLIKKPPVLSSLLAVFVVSGIWHGNTFCFIVWGALQAIFRIGEELAHRFLGKPQKKPPFASRLGKTAFVLVLWVESLVFFAVGMSPGGSVGQAVSLLGRQFVGINPRQTLTDIFDAVYSGVFQQKGFTLLVIAFGLVCLALALWADWIQCFKLKGQSLVLGLRQARPALRWVVYYILILGCFAGFLLQNGGFSGGSFLYEGF